MAMEYRFMRKATPDVRDDGKLTGRAWPYGSWTQIGKGQYGFRERIKLGAGKKSINDGDIVLLDNHETRLPLARMSAGTLVMRDSSGGGEWEADIVRTTYGDDVRKNVKAKNYGGCSFGFEVIRDKWTDDQGNPASAMDGTQREILEMKVHEISVCTFPAYGDGATSVSTKEMIRAARGMTAEDERKVSAAAYNSTDEKSDDERTAAATYSDLTTCGECGSTGQYDAFCTACGESMRSDKPSSEFCGACGSPLSGADRDSHVCAATRGGDAPGNGSKPYGNVTYADPGYQSDKKKRYPLDNEKHIKAAWGYINQAKNAAKYTASQLSSIKSKIKAAMKRIGAKVADSESKMDEWMALSDFREMTEGYNPEGESREYDGGVLPDGVISADDVNWLARDIKAAGDTETRLELITRASDFGIGDILPEHWDGNGGIGHGASEDVSRDMDEIYSLALGMPPTNDALRILDLAQGYLTVAVQEAAQRAAEEPALEPEDAPPLTREMARQMMAEAEERRRRLSH